MSTQSDRGLQFDGVGAGSPRGSNKYAKNQWSGHSNDGRLVNKGRGPTTGNNGECHNPGGVGASVTKDAYRRAPTTGGAQSDTKQYRGVGGTTVKKPGNADSIRVGQSGGNSYGEISRGRRPVAAGSTEGINYGPKSQY